MAGITDPLFRAAARVQRRRAFAGQTIPLQFALRSLRYCHFDKSRIYERLDIAFESSGIAALSYCRKNFPARQLSAFKRFQHGNRRAGELDLVLVLVLNLVPFLKRNDVKNR